ncbi:MAG: DUF4142 domain-containing protein [Chthoniobacteraceae bacterium]
MKKLLLSLVGATLTVGAVAQTPATPATPAATAPTAAEPKPKPLAPPDKKFVKDASDAVLLEQKYLALMTDPKLDMLGETTKRDIKKVGDELKRIWTSLATLATLKGTEVAQEVSKTDLAKIEKLTKEKPDRFDKEFFKDFSRETKKTAKLFESSKTLQDPDVKKFAEDWATVTKGHDLAAETAEKASGKKK